MLERKPCYDINYNRIGEHLFSIWWMLNQLDWMSERRRSLTPPTGQSKWWTQGVEIKEPVRTTWAESRIGGTKSQEAATAGNKKDPEPHIKDWTRTWSRKEEAGNGWEGRGEPLHTRAADELLHGTQCVSGRLTPRTGSVPSMAEGFLRPCPASQCSRVMMGSQLESQFWEKHHHWKDILGSYILGLASVIQAVIQGKRVRTENWSEWQQPWTHS